MTLSKSFVAKKILVMKGEDPDNEEEIKKMCDEHTFAQLVKMSKEQPVEEERFENFSNKCGCKL